MVSRDPDMNVDNSVNMYITKVGHVMSALVTEPVPYINIVACTPNATEFMATFYTDQETGYHPWISEHTWLGHIPSNIIYHTLETVMRVYDRIWQPKMATQILYRIYLERLLGRTDFKMFGTGSRYVRIPPVYDTDEDYVVYVNSSKKRREFLQIFMRLKWKTAPQEDPDYNLPGFFSLRKGYINILLTSSEDYYLEMQEYTNAAKSRSIIDPSSMHSKKNRVRLADEIRTARRKENNDA